MIKLNVPFTSASMPVEAGLGGRGGAQYRRRRLDKTEGTGRRKDGLSRKREQRLGEAGDRRPSERLSDSCADDL